MAFRRSFIWVRPITRSLQHSQIRHNTRLPPPALGLPTLSDAPITRVGKAIHPDELEQLLAEPTWSVDSLLPPNGDVPDAPHITSEQLHHLLRLSALPPPASPEQEQKMLDTLAAQLHFVGKIQQVDTTGVKPLRAIRDETKEAEEDQTITLASLRDALDKEEHIGAHYKRIRRQPNPVGVKDVEDWDVLGSTERKAGKYFVVESERPQE